MGLIVVVVMLVLLFLAFGSLVLPIKAVVMNVVSLAASFGVVTWIFQDGHLSGLLGFTSPGYLDATQPILMLAILFGLSMDYEVFLLSRIREEWDRTGDNTTSVATGVQRTGRIITSAAVLLAVVIGGFATSGIVFMKMIGIGMLVAVLIDATVVRAMLVPATMQLLGDWQLVGARPDAALVGAARPARVRAGRAGAGAGQLVLTASARLRRGGPAAAPARPPRAGLSVRPWRTRALASAWAAAPASPTSCRPSWADPARDRGSTTTLDQRERDGARSLDAMTLPFELA